MDSGVPKHQEKSFQRFCDEQNRIKDENTIDSLRQQITSLQGELQGVNESFARQTAKLATAVAEKNRLQQRVQELEACINNYHDAISRRNSTLYPNLDERREMARAIDEAQDVLFQKFGGSRE